MEDNVLLIDKPSGMTSFGVVARLRRVLSKQFGKKIKVGHTGTLDPFATGLMIIVIGKECKNASFYTKLDKVYEATICLGEVSSTGDPEGQIDKISNVEPALERIEEVLDHFRGEITQSPPIFSAIKINGERAYKLARKGEEFEMPKRQVNVYELKVVDYNYPNLKIRTHVSSGTYIRSLAVDIGEMLQTGAYCSELRRISIGDWSINDAKKLTDYNILD